MKTSEVIEKEKKYLMSTYSRPPFVLDYGKGCYVWDKEGKKYLDLIGGIGSCLIGHGNKGLATVIQKQSQKMITPTNLYYSEPQVFLAEKLVKISGLGHVFFSNSGTEANECAIKLARKATKRSNIITVRFGFHGRTFGSLAGTWDEKYKKDFGPHVPGFTIVPENDLVAVENSITDQTAAVLIEPIQGEAGVKFFDKQYLHSLRDLCTKKGILLILDEVQSGNGRTGTFFAYQQYGILPDIVTVAKGLANGIPIGATIAKKELNFSQGLHGSTFGGNPLACSAALYVMNMVEKKNLMKNASIMGNYFVAQLRNIRSPFITEIRGMGLMIGVELTKEGKEIVQQCADQGLLINCAHKQTLRFLPSLIITKKEINKAIAILRKVLV